MTEIAKAYYAWISWTVDTTQLSDDILHIHAGMAILLLARVLTGRSLATFRPLAFVVVAAIANEVLDFYAHGSWRWDDTLRDVFNTLLWPAVLCLAIRLRPAVLRGR